MADVDDTANVITCLKLLGRNDSAAKLMEVLLAKIHSNAYKELSFSANCSVLLTLLYQDVPRDYRVQITNSIGILCDVWWTAINRIESKGVSCTSAGTYVYTKNLTEPLASIPNAPVHKSGLKIG